MNGKFTYKIILYYFIFVTPLRAQHVKDGMGFIRDVHGKAVANAQLYWLDSTSYVFYTDSLGHFQIDNKFGAKRQLVVTFPSGQIDTFSIPLPVTDVWENVKANSVVNMRTVTVTTTSTNKRLLVGETVAPTVEETRLLPVLLGESDVLKSIQLLPGIKSGGDGNAGFFVRGGSADQNLILLDGATVYNPAHVLGFFSVFNSDALGAYSIYKESFPAQYGGRLSSILDIQMRNGDSSRIKGVASIGVVTPHFSLEGPIAKNKGSFIVSARRTYIDGILKLSKDSSLSKNRLDFFDINAKMHYAFDPKNDLSLTFYKGSDHLGLNNLFNIKWFNTIAALNYKHVFTPVFSSTTRITYSGYTYNFNAFEVDLWSTIKEIGGAQQFVWQPTARHRICFGLSSYYRMLAPSAIEASQSSNYNSIAQKDKNALDHALWFSHDMELSRHWSLQYGLRGSAFQILAPGTFYSFDTDGNVVDSAVYSHKTKILKTYLNIEPRVKLQYNFNRITNLSITFDRNVQNVHLLSSFNASLPTDIWLLSSLNIKPEIANQVSLTYSQTSRSGVYAWNTSVYYKQLENQIDPRDNADVQANAYLEGQILTGKGRAYGWETMIRKKLGRLTGWVSYTLARVEKKINGINSGKYYPASQDRRHEVAVVAMYKLSDKWHLSGDWVFYTGNATTFPIGKYVVNNVVINYYGDRNQNRMPNYHRLDLSATWTTKVTKYGSHAWVFALYNAYGRENAYSINFITDPNNEQKTIAQQIALFRFVPSISYRIQF